MSGFLLGFVLLFNLKESHNKKGLFDYSVKSHFSLKQKLDKPVLRFSHTLKHSVSGYLLSIIDCFATLAIRLATAFT